MDALTRQTTRPEGRGPGAAGSRLVTALAGADGGPRAQAVAAAVSAGGGTAAVVLALGAPAALAGLAGLGGGLVISLARAGSARPGASSRWTTAAAGLEVGAIAVLLGVLLLVDAEADRRPPLALAAVVVLGLAVRHVLLADEARRQSERATLADRRLHQTTTHDALTGLPNRTTATAWLDERLRHDVPTGVLVVDVDRTKLLCDSLGHGAGDAVIVVLAERTRKVVSDLCPIGGDCFTARGDGDELVVVVPGELGPEAVRAVGDQVVRAARAPITIPGHGQVAVSVSVGVALATEGMTAEVLLAGADLAVNEAKHRGRARVEVLDEALLARSEQKVRRQQDLRRAVTRHGEIEVWAQPVVELSSGIPVGAEALVRWRHPYAGVLLPDEFLSAAQEAGMMGEIGATVLDRACATLAAGSVPWIAVNLSSRELYDAGLNARVRDALARHDVDPSRLCLEVNESVLLDAPMLATLKGLEALGVGLAIDDFGVGASSLLQLQLLRRPVLKIDGSFIAQLDGSHADKAAGMIGTFVHLAEQIDVHLVAEGVETESQAERLRQLGVRYAQGYLFARPSAIDEAASDSRWAAWVGPPPWVPVDGVDAMA